MTKCKNRRPPNIRYKLFSVMELLSTLNIEKGRKHNFCIGSYSKSPAVAA